MIKLIKEDISFRKQCDLNMSIRKGDIVKGQFTHDNIDDIKAQLLSKYRLTNKNHCIESNDKVIETQSIRISYSTKKGFEVWNIDVKFISDNIITCRKSNGSMFDKDDVRYFIVK